MGKDHDTQMQHTSQVPGNEHGNEPCQAYRQSLTRYIDAPYTNVRTAHDFPATDRWDRTACVQCHVRGGAPVVVRGREVRPHGEGGQSVRMQIAYELSRSEDV